MHSHNDPTAQATKGEYIAQDSQGTTAWRHDDYPQQPIGFRVWGLRFGFRVQGIKLNCWTQWLQIFFLHSRLMPGIQQFACLFDRGLCFLVRWFL